MITTCTDCGGAYEAGSEEQAYERERWCFRCREFRKMRDRGEPVSVSYGVVTPQEGALENTGEGNAGDN